MFKWYQRMDMLVAVRYGSNMALKKYQRIGRTLWTGGRGMVRTLDLAPSKASGIRAHAPPFARHASTARTHHTVRCTLASRLSRATCPICARAHAARAHGAHAALHTHCADDLAHRRDHASWRKAASVGRERMSK